MYAAVGVPLGRLADRSNRSRILAVGVFFWSLMTAASGLTRNFWQLFVVRLGVGVGEATCPPTHALTSCRPTRSVSIMGGKALQRQPFIGGADGVYNPKG
jgi:MFS family permease